MKAAFFGQFVLSSRLLEAEVVEEESDIEESDEEGPHGLVDSSSEDEGKAYEELSAKHKAHRDSRLAYERARHGCRTLAEDNDSDPEGSTGNSLPVLMKTGSEETIDQDAVRQTPLSKPTVLTKTGRWKSRRTRSRLNLATGEVKECQTKRLEHRDARYAPAKKDFEEMTVGELRKVVAKSQSKLVSFNPLSEDTMIAPPEVAAEGVENAVVSEWYDQEELCPLYEDDGDKPQEILGFSWRSEPEVWADKKWVKVKSVVDAGASSPVAPPSMLPKCEDCVFGRPKKRTDMDLGVEA